MRELLIAVSLFVGAYAVVASFIVIVLWLTMEDELIPQAIIWPLWLFVILPWRAIREHLPERDEKAEPVRVVYRYPARTWLSALTLVLWRLLVAGLLAWLAWREMGGGR